MAYKNKYTPDVYKLTSLAILTALVFLLQFFVKIPLGTFNVSVSLTVIVIGAAMFGFVGGAWLGAVSAVAILLNGDAALFFGFNVFFTIFIVMLKGIMSGIAAAGAFELLKKVNLYLAVTVSAIIAPIVNTGIFFLGSVVFFLPNIKELAGTQNAITFILTAFIGLNFIVELILNIVLIPLILRLLYLLPISQKKYFRGYSNE